MLTKHFFSTIYQRRSVRRFRSDSIDNHILQRVLEAARWAPSGGNGQGWRFGIVTEMERKLALAEAAGRQMWIAEAPVVLACCSHLVVPTEGDAFSQEVNRWRWGDEASAWIANCEQKQLVGLLLGNGGPMLPGAHIQLAAAALGLGTCWIGFLDVERASQILQLPDDLRCYYLMPLGYPAEEMGPRARLPLSSLTFSETWGREWAPAVNSPAFGEVHIRPYCPEDEADWLDLWGQVAVTSKAWVMLHHHKPRYKGPAFEIVAELNGELVGFMDVECEAEPGELGLATDSCCGFVWEFGVRSDHRRRGIARAMIEAAEKWLATQGIKRMEFWSMDSCAQGFYKHLGMEELERHWQFYLQLPKALKAQVKADGVHVTHTYGTCSIDHLEKVRELYNVRDDAGEKAEVCIGFNHSW